MDAIEVFDHDKLEVLIAEVPIIFIFRRTNTVTSIPGNINIEQLVY
jgi:hypothetical protein